MAAALETTQIGLVSYGVLKPKTWLGGPEEAGFYHMKGVIHSLLNLLGISDVKYLPKAGMPFHPGRSAKIAAHMSTVGEIGDLHPACLKELDIPVPVTACWLSLDGLLSMVKPKGFVPPSRLMPVERDLAVIVPEEVPGGEVVEAIRQTGRHLDSVALFDVWRKPPVPPGHKSLAFRLVYLPTDKTLTEEDLAEDRRDHGEVAERLQCGAEILRTHRLELPMPSGQLQVFWRSREPVYRCGLTKVKPAPLTQDFDLELMAREGIYTATRRTSRIHSCVHKSPPPFILYLENLCEGVALLAKQTTAKAIPFRPVDSHVGHYPCRGAYSETSGPCHA